VLFYATPDMLSGLCGWAFFGNNAPDAVVSQFGSGCSTVVSMTVVENEKKGDRCFIPYSRFVQMTETMKECFLFDSHAWAKVKARLEE